MEEPKRKVDVSFLSPLHLIHVSLPGAWSPFSLEHSRRYPTTAQLNSPEHIQVPGNRWDASKGVEQAAWCHFEVTLYHLWKVMTTGGGYWWLEKGRHHTHLQERQEERSRELEANQPNLISWEGCGANPLRSHF